MRTHTPALAASPHNPSPSAVTAPSALTIDRHGVYLSDYVRWWKDAQQHAALLEAIYLRRKDKCSPEADALWAGINALTAKAATFAEHARQDGGILHLVLQ